MNKKFLPYIIAAILLTTSVNAAAKEKDDKNFNSENVFISDIEVDENYSDKSIENLPIVIEEMPEDDVKDKYFKIVFVPETKYIDFQIATNKELGKLLNTNGEELALREGETVVYSQKYNYIGKEYYALKTANWSQILNYKLKDNSSLSDLRAENTESDPEKKEIHKFRGWELFSKSVNLKDSESVKKVARGNNQYDTSRAVVFKSTFLNAAYLFDHDIPIMDFDNYPFHSENFYIISFSTYGSHGEKRESKILLSDFQKNYTYEDVDKRNDLNFFLRKDFKDVDLSNFIPIASDYKDYKFWYWFKIGYPKNNILDFSAEELNKQVLKPYYLFDGEEISGENDLDKNILPEGFYSLRFKTEDGYKFSNFLTYHIGNNIVYVKKEGLSTENIKNLPEKPIIIDKDGNKYSDSVYWYCNDKKVDNIRDIKVNSDMVFVARFEREADKFIPQTNEIEINLNEDVTLEKLKEGITNLKDDIKNIEIKEKIDTSKVGNTKAIVIISFTDDSSKEVEIPIKIIEKIAGSEIIPIPKIDEKDIEIEEVAYNGKINLLDNIKNLPDEAIIEDITNKEIDTKIPGNYMGLVKVIYKNGSSRILEIPIVVELSLADKYPIIIPEKTLVDDEKNLKEREIYEIREKVLEANPYAKEIFINEKGQIILLYQDESENILNLKDFIVIKDQNPKENEDDNHDNPKEEDDTKDNSKEEDSHEKEDDIREEIPNKKDENNENLDSWDYLPKFYKRDHSKEVYKVKTKIRDKIEKGKSKKVIIYLDKDFYQLTYGDEIINIDMEKKPFIKDGRIMIPMRDFAEILDAKVLWKEITRTASFTRDGLRALINIDSDVVFLSRGEKIILDTKPLNIKDRIYLPLSNFAQVFGLISGNTKDGIENDIEWDEDNRTLIINIK